MTKKKLEQAKQSSKILNLGDTKQPGKMSIKNKELHEAKKAAAKSISNVAWMLEVQKDWSIGLRTSKGVQVRTMDVLRSALFFCYTESVKQYDLMSIDSTDQEKEDLLYGMLVHDITGTQITMYDMIKEAYPEFNQDKLEKMLSEGKEKIIQYIMEEIDKFYQDLQKDLDKKNSTDEQTPDKE